MPTNDSVKVSKLILILTFCCSLLLLEGCSALRDLAQSIQKPRLSVTDVRVTDFNFSEIELTYDVTVDNPNALSVQMLSYGYDLKINGRNFVNGQQKEKSRIEASGESTFQVPMTLNFKEIYSTFKSLANSEEVAYDFSSTVAFDLPGLGSTEVPVNKKGNIPLIHVPSVRVNNLEIKDISLTQATLSLNMEFDNPNTFGLSVEGFNYDLDINGAQWAEGNALEGVSISQNETTQLQIPITLNLSEMGLSVYKMLAKSQHKLRTESQKIDYKLTGNFTFGTTHPLLGQTNFTFNRTGQISLNDNN